MNLYCSYMSALNHPNAPDIVLYDHNDLILRIRILDDPLVFSQNIHQEGNDGDRGQDLEFGEVKRTLCFA